MRTGKALAAALMATLALAACGHSPPKATVDTCATAIEQHPDSAAYPAACKGLTADQLFKATAVAMAHGARG